MYVAYPRTTIEPVHAPTLHGLGSTLPATSSILSANLRDPYRNDMHTERVHSRGTLMNAFGTTTSTPYALCFASLLAILATLSVVTPHAIAYEPPAQPALTPEQMEEIRNGETVVRTRRGQVNRGEVIGFVCAPEDEIWSIITDFAHMTEWFPDMGESIVISQGPDGNIGQGRTIMPWPVADRTWQTNVSAERRQVGRHDSYVATYSYVPGSGNMDELYGYWLVRQYDEECSLVRYVVNADLGTRLPDAVITWAQRRLLPGVITGLRERHAELF